MSIVRMRINKHLQVDEGPRPQVFASITRMDDRGRTVPSSLRHELVPISTLERDGQPIRLETGAYTIEVRLPTGEILVDSVNVREGIDQDFVLMAEESSHDWLSWQHLAGNTLLRRRSPTSQHEAERTHQMAREKDSGSEPVISKSRRSSRSRGISNGPSGARSLLYSEIRSLPAERDLFGSIGLRISNGRAVPVETRDVPSAWAPKEVAQVNPTRAIHWLRSDSIGNDREFLRQDPWHTLSALKGSTDNIVAGLRAGAIDRTIRPSISDNFTAVFSVTSGHCGRDFANRDFVAVRRRQGVELVCLPIPWIESWSDRNAAVEVSVQVPRYEREFSSSVIVRDQQLTVLLGFLSTGAFSAVKRLAEVSNIMLLEKNANPLAAAAGGYALVGSAIDASHQSWHGWIENLMERFSQVPDGAIQYATMRLRLRRSAKDVEAATTAFKEAYRRGLPFYSMGLRWLLDGLERADAKDAEAKEMATAVRQLASRLHPQSPFTILRLGKH